MLVCACIYIINIRPKLNLETITSNYVVKKSIDYSLRNSDSSYVLPQCKFNIFQRSFINWCLFNL